jgi:hypothetical protein
VRCGLRSARLDLTSAERRRRRRRRKWPGRLQAMRMWRANRWTIFPALNYSYASIDRGRTWLDTCGTEEVLMDNDNCWVNRAQTLSQNSPFHGGGVCRPSSNGCPVVLSRRLLRRYRRAHGPVRVAWHSRRPQLWGSAPPGSRMREQHTAPSDHCGEPWGSTPIMI